MTERLQQKGINRRQWLATTCLVGTLYLYGQRSLAGEASDEVGDEAGFVSLFDGKTLDGWHATRQRNSHGTGGQWQVENGVLTGEQDPPGSGNGGVLLSDRRFGDFELLIEMKPDWGPCSGVFFRTNEAGAGFQMYVDYHDRGNVGHLRGEIPGGFAGMPFKIFGRQDDSSQLTGLTAKPDPRALEWSASAYEYCCTSAQFLAAWRVGHWNTARIRCQGKYPQITTWINGVKMCQFQGATSTLPGYDKDRVLKELGTEGSIGLQVHGGNGWPKGAKCRWRKIRIKAL